MCFARRRPVLSVVTVFKHRQNMMDSAVGVKRPSGLRQARPATGQSAAPSERNDTARNSKCDGLGVGHDTQFLARVGHEKANCPL